MPQLVFSIPNFGQTSTWRSWLQLNNVPTSDTPSTDTDDKYVNISTIPAGATISSAVLSATIGEPFRGAAIRTVNGADFDAPLSVKTTLQALNGVYTAQLKFQFKFRTYGGTFGDETYEGEIHTSAQTYSNIKLTVDYSLPYTSCSAPTSATLSATVAEASPTLSWSGAAGGSSNPITSYEIQYAESSNSSTWGAWTALKTVTSSAASGSTTVDLPSTRGYYRKYRIRTRGSAGSNYYSAWKETAAVRKNSAPSAPTLVVATPEVFEFNDIVVSWSGATDADNNIQKYLVQRSWSADGITYNSWITIFTEAVGPGVGYYIDLSRGYYIKFRVQAIDAFGVSSEYAESAPIQKNSVPYAPAINQPGSGKTTYNSRPRILVTVGNDADAQNQAIAANGYTVSTSGAQPAGKGLILRKVSAASAGTVSLSVVSTDTLGAASSATEKSLTYAEPSFTDAVLSAGTTRVKAAHMNELRTMANTVRDYYGLSAYSWAEIIEAGTTPTGGWAEHVAELRMAIDEVVAYVNAWDSTATANKITLPAWLEITSNRPRADVIEQIRAAITVL